MTLVNEGCVCGLCETRGHDVKHTPDTFPRILQALDLNKLPPALTEQELGEKVGLCNKCERQIKLLEEAASIRETLKESLVSNLKHLSGNYSVLQHYNNKTTPECLSFGQTFQHINEITPDLHSMKRKLSHWSADNQASRRKQLKTHITHTLPISPASVITDHANSSDEENSRITNHLVSPVSPRSSNGSYTPPLASAKHSIDNQVLSELTCRNRRKQARPAKAAGEVVPAVPSHIISAQMGAALPSPFTTLRTPTPDQTSQRHSRPTTPSNGDTVPRRSPTPQSSSRDNSVKSYTGVPSPRTNAQAMMAQLMRGVSPKPPTSSQLLRAASPKPIPSVSPRPQKSHTPSTSTANISQLPISQATAAGTTMPFNAATLPFTSFYQNNLSNMFGAPLQSNNSSASAMLLAQSIYNAAATKSTMLGLNNLPFLGQGMPQMSGVNGISPKTSAAGQTNLYNKALPSFNYSDLSSLQKNKDLLPKLPAKPEPSIPQFRYAPTKGSTNSSSQSSLPALKKTSMTAESLGQTIAADAHTLVKTDKRRYCKVCAASCRKANNGRPPQSRFLCLACNMPMCRSCIEEHRYRIMMKVEDKPSTSASAKLLKAVKMKQESKCSSTSPSTPYSKLPSLSSKPGGVSSSTPPSHSSLIYGSAGDSLTPTSSASIPSGLPAMPSLIGQHTPKSTLNPLDMRIPGYKHIVPAPPKLTIMSPRGASDVVKSEPVVPEDVTTDTKPPTDVEVTIEEVAKAAVSPAVVLPAEVDDDEEEGALVISEQDGDHTDGEITAELASKTAAMLASMGDDDSLDSTDKEILMNNQPFHSNTTSSSAKEGAINLMTIPADNEERDSCSPISVSPSPVLPPMMGAEKDCSPISENPTTIPLQKCALTV